MILKKLRYSEHKDSDRFWEIKNLEFGMMNLIIGLNATGKTRLIRIIDNFAKLLSKKTGVFLSGAWEIEFDNKEKGKYKYKLELHEGKIEYEELKLGRKVLLKRIGDKGRIESVTQKRKIKINPPINELTLHVRRDLKDHPFLEDLFNWAESLLGYQFTNARTDFLFVPLKELQLESLQDLGAVPYILKSIIDDKMIKKSIISDCNAIGYPIEDINIDQVPLQNSRNLAYIVVVKEMDVKFPIHQMNMSQGMYRALSLVIIIAFLLKTNKECTVVVDDVGEGLDFQRASKLTEILFNKLEGTNIQLIVTSNDRYLINSVNFRLLNILERKGQEVEAYNYTNSKKIFDEFKYTGLNNFDLFADKMFKDYETD
jgi:predicted ATPase